MRKIRLSAERSTVFALVFARRANTGFREVCITLLYLLCICYTLEILEQILPLVKSRIPTEYRALEAPPLTVGTHA